MALEESASALTEIASQRTEALAQRDVLLREVYHRVKNNLQLIDSCLVMQGRVLTDPHAKLSLKSLRGRVHALGLVHHQLMAAKDLATFDFAPFLKELVDNIVQSGPENDVNLTVIAEPIVMGLDLAIPLGLIVTELVTNAVKRAFPAGRGNIVVRFTHRGDDIWLLVSDDGRGMAAAKADPALGSTGLARKSLKLWCVN